MDADPSFLDLDASSRRKDHAEAWILPIPLEATVSYGRGTVAGPRAIIAASGQVELYDAEFKGEPALAYGVHTLPTLRLPENLEQALAVISQTVSSVVSLGKLAVALGGEHTVSVGCVGGVLAAAPGPVTVIQIDAHCDLRDSYEGSPYSHACVARRLLEVPGVEGIVQFGVRSLCREEAEFIVCHPEQVRVYDMDEIHGDRWQEDFIGRIAGKRIYMTIDVDGLDPSIIPATGTPEPDGLSWRNTMDILKTAATHGTILGLDCVELAPAANLHMADFAAAKLVYKAMSHAMRSRRDGKGVGASYPL